LELDRIIKQRNTLLKQLGGRITDDGALTLDVWDTKLAGVGDQFGNARAVLVARLSPLVLEAYEQLAEHHTGIELRYEPLWRQRGLAVALADGRAEDVRRGVSTIGPHRDDVELFIDGMPARTHASQGEQRTLALALRLGAHRLITDKAGSAPVLVLDDVLSELDPARCAALLRHLPPGQVVLTTAGVLPEVAHPDAVLRIEAGMVMS
jgi:DNA replication and repair protein RecF